MTIKIGTIERQLSKDGKANVCLHVHYTAKLKKTVGKYDDIKTYSASMYSSIRLPDPSGNFIEYDNLTEPMVEEWVKDLIGKENLEKMETGLTSNINEQIAPTKMKGTPW